MCPRIPVTILGVTKSVKGARERRAALDLQTSPPHTRSDEWLCSWNIPGSCLLYFRQMYPTLGRGRRGGGGTVPKRNKTRKESMVPWTWAGYPLVSSYHPQPVFHSTSTITLHIAHPGIARWFQCFVTTNGCSFISKAGDATCKKTAASVKTSTQVIL